MPQTTHIKDTSSNKIQTKQSKQDDQLIFVIGIGNVYRSDDGVGFVIAQHLKEQASDTFTVIKESGDGITLMESWESADAVILIDAVYSGAKPGTIHRFDAHVQQIPAQFFHLSTHAFGIAEAVELARILGRLPSSLIVYGIEGKCFEAGEGLSVEVSNAAQEVVLRIRQDILKINHINTRNGSEDLRVFKSETRSVYPQ